MSTDVTSIELDEYDGDKYMQKDTVNFCRVPAPIYRRFGVPSGPWPWEDFDVEPSEVHSLLPGRIAQDSEWCYYPQSLFWTHNQVERSRILSISHKDMCKVHTVDMSDDGFFVRSDDDCIFEVESPRAYWNHLGTLPSPNVRVRVLFIENMTVPILQILGTKFGIDPLFFTSSANWIPSRYQEGLEADRDHITVVLPFIRTITNPIKKSTMQTRPAGSSTFPLSRWNVLEGESSRDECERWTIDTQEPLLLPNNRVLLHDLLAIHMYRTSTTSTIISCHPYRETHGTSAKRLQSIVQTTGNSGYWSKIFQKSKDPTFLFLAILWYVLCAWDDAYDELYHYVRTLESDVLRRNDDDFTQELCKLQAHLLYYKQLLDHFRVSVNFIQDTPSPAMNVLASTDKERFESAKLLCREAEKLLFEIDRLTLWRTMLSQRLRNVMSLASARVRVEDSKSMQRLGKITMTNSGMIWTFYLGVMIFLPASFLANVFSMNVHEINLSTTGQLRVYIEVTVGLIVLTWWTTIAFQRYSAFHSGRMMERIFWPILYIYVTVPRLVKDLFISLKSLKCRLSP